MRAAVGGMGHVTEQVDENRVNTGSTSLPHLQHISCSQGTRASRLGTRCRSSQLLTPKIKHSW